VLIFNMFAGRLEIVTVFVLFTWGWWRRPHGLMRGRGGGQGAAGGPIDGA
jgi:Trk-type K+ transport system membrane component